MLFYINAGLKQYAVNLHNKYNLPQHNEEDLFVCEFIANCRHFCVSTGKQRFTSKNIYSTKDTLKTFNLRVLSSNYYSNNLGFFCKKELQLEKAVKFPLKFRLGSVAYCDAIGEEWPASPDQHGTRR